VSRFDLTRLALKASAGLLAAALLAFGFATARADDSGAPAVQRGAAVIQSSDTLVNPVATAEDATPTPTPAASVTPVPFETPVPAGATPTPTPIPSQGRFGSPGYGNAAKQTTKQKQREQRRACKYAASVPPTSHMLGVPGIASGPGGSGGSWVPLVLAIAVGAGLFAAGAFLLRTKGKTGGTETLEGLATIVAICGSLAALAAQFVPSARVEPPPPQRVSMVVRDVKPRITRGEYLRQMGIPTTAIEDKENGLRRVDLDEVGNVVWLQITVEGLKGHGLRLQYGSYNLDGGLEALLPDTSKPVELNPPRHNVQTYFYPAWVGYPRSQYFKAEFRLIDSQGGGVQQIAATGRMKGTQFRYVCPRHTA
jgi:hypothetical protein